MPSGPIRILLIEDNLAEARFLEEVLKGARFNQFKLVQVQRLKAALRRLETEEFDVILLDLTLPDSQGLASLPPLIDQAPRLPIVVLTNTNDDQLAIAAVRSGAQDYLVKRQVNMELLVRSLHYAIERKQASEALREANEALEMRVQERTAELAQANDLLRQEIREHEQALRERQKIQEELQRSNAELRQFAYVASHDLQEPLRTVTSFVQLLARRYQNELDANANDYINYIVDGTKRMQELILALLGYSRVGRSPRELEPVDCNVLLQITLQHLEGAIASSQAIVTYGNLPTVMADPVQLGQLFQNLLENAIKYRSSVQPRVHVSATLRDLNRENFAAEQADFSLLSHLSQEWLFSVQDNGIGIEPEYFERIFLIFQRLHARSDYPGTGIGLALCQKIVEQHRGKIWVESRFGSGSTFYFTLPQFDRCPIRQPKALAPVQLV